MDKFKIGDKVFIPAIITHRKDIEGEYRLKFSDHETVYYFKEELLLQQTPSDQHQRDRLDVAKVIAAGMWSNPNYGFSDTRIDAALREADALLAEWERTGKKSIYVDDPEGVAVMEDELKKLRADNTMLRDAAENDDSNFTRLRDHYIECLYALMDDNLTFICVNCGLKGEKATECNLKNDPYSPCTFDFYVKEEATDATDTD
jgi:hypothetical protein